VTTDIIGRIDQAIHAATSCGNCGQQLPAKNGSGDFCDMNCQTAWHLGRVTNPGEVLRRTDYRVGDLREGGGWRDRVDGGGAGPHCPGRGGTVH
jgi:hypothetical protein